jgi:DNA-binding MarR family transcriptional regulator
VENRRCNPDALESDSLDLAAFREQQDRPLGIAYLTARLERAIRNRIRRELKPLGVTVPQYTALSVFCSSAGLSNAKLAERTLVSPQAANELIKGMEKFGWISRSPDPHHGRVIHINLTEKGDELLDRCNRLIASVEREMLEELNDSEISELHRQLRCLVSTFRCY